MRSSLHTCASRARPAHIFGAQTFVARHTPARAVWACLDHRPLLPRLYTTKTAVSQSQPALNRENANPPASTRPAPLDLPERKPDTSTFSHLFATGKAYLGFYKTGLKNIYVNWQLLRAIKESSANPPETRNHLQLQARTQHDVRRLPVFGLLLVIFGEFTPFVVLVVPSLVPFTCRIPKQIDVLLRRAETRRKQSFADLTTALQGAEASGTEKIVSGHIARSLGLIGSPWDRIGPWAPKWLSLGRVDARLKFLARDDALLIGAGGVQALEPSEVRLACSERGINVLERSDQELSTALDKWLRYTSSADDTSSSSDRMIKLLTESEDKWPSAK